MIGPRTGFSFLKKITGSFLDVGGPGFTKVLIPVILSEFINLIFP